MNPWERQLAEEGLGELDSKGCGVRRDSSGYASFDQGGKTEARMRARGSLRVSNRSASQRVAIDCLDKAEAVERWQAWARAVIDSPAITTPKQRAIWVLYAEGRSYSQIQAAVGGSRRSVSWAVAAVESAAPPKPCANPWRQDLRGHEQLQDPRIAWYAARRRRRAAAKQLKQPQEDEDMPPNPIQRFARVLFVGHDVEWPGQRPTDRLINANGRYVNGGIEFYSMVIKGNPDQVKEFPRAIWVSGPRIKQADREQEGT